MDSQDQFSEMYVCLSELSDPSDLFQSQQVEYLMLSTLPLKVTCGNVTVTTPKAYTYLDDSNTSVFEDIPSTWKLKDALRTGECFPPNVAASVGRALARFTIALYNWSRQPEQAELRERLEGCQWSTNLCYLLTYGQLTAALEKHPDLIGDKAEYIEQARELGRQAIFEKHMHWGIIHADYWTGNVLLPKDLSNCSEEPITLHLLGWEMSKYTSPFFDIGQMMAYLYLPFHFHGIVAGQAAVEAVCQEVSKSPLMEIPRFPFLVAMHFGVHLIVCPYRPPQPEAKEKLNSCIGYGGEVIKAAMTEDVNWLRRSVLGQLFVNV